MSSSPYRSHSKIFRQRSPPRKNVAKYTSVANSKSDGISTINDSFRLTQQERDMVRYKLQNDKVVGFYKKVLTDIRGVLQLER
jgi:hypothetical protein